MFYTAEYRKVLHRRKMLEIKASVARLEAAVREWLRDTTPLTPFGRQMRRRRWAVEARRVAAAKAVEAERAEAALVGMQAAAASRAASLALPWARCK